MIASSQAGTCGSPLNTKSGAGKIGHPLGLKFGTWFKNIFNGFIGPTMPLGHGPAPKIKFGSNCLRGIVKLSLMFTTK